jgi:hypothetical protein
MKWGILMFFVAIVYALQLGINGIIIYKATRSLSLYFRFFLLVLTFVYLGIRGSNYASSAS